VRSLPDPSAPGFSVVGTPIYVPEHFPGGQHVADIFGVDAAIQALFTADNRDVRMGQLYDDYVAMWRQQGGALFVNYTAIERPGRFGAWGVFEHVGQETSPKYDALMRAIGAANP
jgi:hypothetical protein